MVYIRDYIKANSEWEYTNNCSTLASEIWNKLATIPLNAGTPNTARTLRQSIISTNNYDTCAEMGDFTDKTYRYYFDITKGEFEKMDAYET